MFYDIQDVTQIRTYTRAVKEIHCIGKQNR